MDVLMPQLGETVTEGTIASWHKQVGDTVEKGDVLVDIETDKISTEIEVPVSGVLVKIDVAEGETVDVGTVLATVLEAGATETRQPISSVDEVAGRYSRVTPQNKRSLNTALREIYAQHTHTSP